LTEQNNKLVIEDDFGLPSDRKTEQKHLKQTQVILEIFDQYIDSMLPVLEKFFTKWDPEALQIAKELEAKTVKAQKDTKEAQMRRPSMDARPTQPTPYTTNQPSSSSGYNQAGYYPNDYGAYDQYYPQENNQFEDFSGGSKGGGGGSAAPSGKPVEAKTPTTPEAPKVDAKKAAAKETYEGVVESLEDHLDIFGEEYTEKVNEFFDNEAYPQYQPYPKVKDDKTFQTRDPQPFELGETKDWVAGVCKPAIASIFETSKNTIKREITSAHSVISDIRQSLKSMDADTLKKLSNNSKLNALEERFNSYSDKYDKFMQDLETTYASNINKLNSDQTAQKDYADVHSNFTRDLREILGEPLSEIKNEFSVLKHKIRREIRNKSK
ncbi:hypothetical protein KBD08_03935, partial [Candidatus Babeliales bacterium]|nr:hypothetical protein [Candidatus Babeliales bacterium]